MIPFNKVHLTGKEEDYIRQALNSGKLSGNGEWTKKCQDFFEQKYGIKKCLLTTSCTDALEMCAILADIQPGDEVIIPSYTFVSTALAFVRQGAKIVFADSCKNHPNIDTGSLEELITPRTKAIVPVHYAGASCNMDSIISLSKKYNLLIIEDAAQSIDSFWKPVPSNSIPLGSIGHFAAFSFHETKNIISGEGGMLAVNDERFANRAEIIWEKGTNRSEFFRGEVNKYGWKDTGSSFLPSEITSAFLFAQLEELENVQKKRKQIWNWYFDLLTPLADKGSFSLPQFPSYSANNAHMFYIICNSLKDRTDLLGCLKQKEVYCVFHYLCLHKSDFYKDKHDGRELKNAENFENCLLRLPFYYDLTLKDLEYICSSIKGFYSQ